MKLYKGIFLEYGMNPYIKILLWSSFFSAFAAGLLAPIYAIFVTDIGGDVLLAGSTFAVFSIVTGVITLSLANWEDRVKHKERLLICARLLLCVGFFGYLFVSEPWHLFIIQVIFGVASAIGLPAFDALFSSHLDKGRSAFEWGIWESMFAIVSGISALAGSYIVYLFGFKLLFLIMFIFSCFSFFVTLLLQRRKVRLHRHTH